MDNSTPRTDAAWGESDPLRRLSDKEKRDFAREIERENQTLRAAQKSCEDCDAPTLAKYQELERANQRLREDVSRVRKLASEDSMEEQRKRVNAEKERDQWKARLEKMADVVWSIRWEPGQPEFEPLGALAAEIRSGNHQTIDQMVAGDSSALDKLTT